jgi:hypothetical protein
MRAFQDTASGSLIGVEQHFKGETPVYSETTWSCISVGSHLHTSHCKNLKSHKSYVTPQHFSTYSEREAYVMSSDIQYIVGALC